MKKKDKKININNFIIAYLLQNKLKLSKQTMKTLASGIKLDPSYYGILQTPDRIMNFFLENSILWNDDVYDFIIHTYQDYDENILLNILKDNLYSSADFWKYAVDIRIPKLNKETNYLNLIASQDSLEEVNIAYQALIHPFFRNDKFYLEQIANMADNKKSLVNKKTNKKTLLAEMKILEDADKQNKVILKQKIAKYLNNYTSEQKEILNNFFVKLMYYEDYDSIRKLLLLNDLTPYMEIIKACGNIKNIDEFLIIRNTMLWIINYKIRKDNIYNNYHFECLDFDETVIPNHIKEKQNSLLKKGYLNAYMILATLEEEFMKYKAEEYVLKRK